MLKATLVSLALLLIVVNSQTFPSCVGEVNNSPLIVQDPKLQAETANGQKYLIQEGNNILYLLNLTGTPYQMGHAYGKLMAKEIDEMAGELVEWCEKVLDDYMTDLSIPKFIRDIVIEAGYNLALYLLDMTWKLAEPFTPERYVQEMQGMADGAGLSVDEIIQINMIPELLRASCTIVGSWGGSAADDGLLTLRSLDWDPYAPVTRYPLVAVYHSTVEGSYPFANIGMTGLIGALTAAGSQGISVGEKLWGADKYTYKGKPWTFALRDLAQFGTTLQSMADSLYNTNRTCAVHFGMASAQSEAYEGVNYCYEFVNFFTDKNYTGYSQNHPQIDGIFYLEEHHGSQYDACVGNILKESWGKITWETLFRGVGGLDRTGDTQVCAINVYTQEMYVSYSGYPTGEFGFFRSPIYVDLRKFYGTSGSLKPKVPKHRQQQIDSEL